MNKIIITPQEIAATSLTQGAVMSTTYHGFPCISLPNSITPMVRVTTPIPSDWNGVTIKTTVQYTSQVNSGEFLVKQFGSFVETDNSVHVPLPQLNEVIPAPVSAYSSKEWLEEMALPVSPKSSYLNIMIRRDANNVSDTCVGELEIVGIILEKV